MKEHMVHIWGGAWNSDACPSIENDLGIEEGYHYFKSEKAKDAFLRLLNNPAYKMQGLMIDEKYGEMRHERTVFVGILEYRGERYTIHCDFGYEYPEEVAINKFLNGDYACDCNRSLFIRREYEDAVPELECGEKIKLIGWHIEYVK